MRQPDVIELTDRYGVVITVCRNSETVCDGLELDECDEDSYGEIYSAAVDAIEAQLGRGVETDGFFANWHGGKYDKGFKQGLAHASFRTRTIDECADEDGEEYFSYGDWEWVDYKAVPEEIVAKVQAAFDAASDAVAKVSAEREELHRKAVAEAALEAE